MTIDLFTLSLSLVSPKAFVYSGYEVCSCHFFSSLLLCLSFSRGHHFACARLLWHLLFTPLSHPSPFICPITMTTGPLPPQSPGNTCSVCHSHRSESFHLIHVIVFFSVLIYLFIFWGKNCWILTLSYSRLCANWWWGFFYLEKWLIASAICCAERRRTELKSLIILLSLFCSPTQQDEQGGLGEKQFWQSHWVRSCWSSLAQLH